MPPDYRETQFLEDELTQHGLPKDVIERMRQELTEVHYAHPNPYAVEDSKKPTKRISAEIHGLNLENGTIVDLCFVIIELRYRYLHTLAIVDRDKESKNLYEKLRARFSLIPRKDLDYLFTRITMAANELVDPRRAKEFYTNILKDLDKAEEGNVVGMHAKIDDAIMSQYNISSHPGTSSDGYKDRSTVLYWNQFDEIALHIFEEGKRQGSSEEMLIGLRLREPYYDRVDENDNAECEYAAILFAIASAIRKRDLSALKELLFKAHESIKIVARHDELLKLINNGITWMEQAIPVDLSVIDECVENSDEKRERLSKDLKDKLYFACPDLSVEDHNSLYSKLKNGGDCIIDPELLPGYYERVIAQFKAKKHSYEECVWLLTRINEEWCNSTDLITGLPVMVAPGSIN